VPALVLISGLSGSGKTHALRCLEDLGYLCVDNLPATLIPRFAELVVRSLEASDRGAALAVDVREGRFLPQLVPTVRQLRADRNLRVTLLFFEASDPVLVRRFSETRRPHPLVEQASSLAEAIAQERELLGDLKAAADRIVDTSNLTVHDLRRRVQDDFGTAEDRAPQISVVSFGFKHGLPPDADFVLDARFLPNPFFIPALRGLDGRDSEVREFLEDDPDYGEFVSRIRDMLGFLMPRYLNEGRAYLTVGIGCTGGRHRSVALAEAVGGFLRESGHAARVSHRDVDRE
jgi:UPF0042 nucleotide-binding protein